MALVSVTPPKAGKSHRIRRVGRGVGDRGGPEGFRTNSGEQRRWGRAAGRTAPCAPSRRLPRAAARSGPRLPLRPARLQPGGLRLADRSGLHLPACEPHPDPRRRRPRAPHSSLPPALPLRSQPGSQPLTARSSRLRLGTRAATGARARVRGAAAIGRPPQWAKRSLPAQATNGVPSSRPLASQPVLHPSLPAPSVPDPLELGAPAPFSSARTSSLERVRPPLPLPPPSAAVALRAGGRADSGAGRGGGSCAGEAGGARGRSNLSPAEPLPFYGNEGPGVGLESNIRALRGGT